MKYKVQYEKTENGYSAHVPDLPGCIAAGSSFQQTGTLIGEAIQLHLSGMKEDLQHN
jgi:predicted RNase H-like HicB family nuclease